MASHTTQSRLNQPLKHERARVACHRCHEKKIRCNASQVAPCSNCATNNLRCVLIESRRGRYPRKPRDSEHPRPVANAAQTGTGNVQGFATDLGSCDQRSPSSVAALVGHHSSESHNSGTDELDDWTRSRTAVGQPIGQEPSSTPRELDDHSPEMLYAQIAERSVNGNEEPIRHVGESAFLGETFSLTYVVHEVLAPFLSRAPFYQRRLHFPIVDNTSRKQQHLSSRKDAVITQIELLRSRGLYNRPPLPVLTHLLQLFFDHFHPAFPLVEKAKYLQPARAEQHSLLVLNAVLMIAVTLCNEDILKTAGFVDRHAARLAFYRQARCLYEADVEHDKLDNIRGVFLMSFWWGGPNDQKDSWYWLGIAINLAQSLGLHRNTRTSRIERSTATRWKLIWWSLRVRDGLISASIGRPQHVWQGDCDVEQPEMIDVMEELGDKGPEVSNYFLQTAKLSAIVSRIISSRYPAIQPRFSSDDRVSLESEMSVFADEIPAELRSPLLDPISGQGLWGAMLTMAYNYAMILLCRKAHPSPADEQVQQWGNSQKAVAAANAITRCIEDLLSASMIRLCQVHTIAALFNALAVHVYLICTSDTVIKGLAKTRAQVCMMGLASLQQSWPVGSWVLKLFDSIMARLKMTAQDAYANKRARTLRQEKNLAVSAENGLPHSPIIDSTSEPVRRSRPQTEDQTTFMAQHGQNLADDQGQGNNIAFDYAQDSSGQLVEPSMAFDFENMPNMFAFDESIGRPGTDQDNFFHWLDFASVPDFGRQSPW